MIPFAFFGVDYCSGSSGGVGGSRQDSTAAKITEAEFAQAMRDQQEQLRRSAQGVDPAILDNPEVRFNLGCSRLLREQARRERRAATSHFRVSNRGLRPHRRGPALSRGRALLARSSTRTCCGSAGIDRARVRGQHPPSDPRRAASSIPIARERRRPRSRRPWTFKCSLVEQQRGGRVSRNIDVETFVKDVSASTRRRKRRSTTPTRPRSETPEEAKFEYVVLTPGCGARRSP